ncbi:MAG: hypothetical protein IPM56_01310 [Ignavibacteriales bacterium]|nr:MAG: hypothetical protein IPM56_01310 [Ignavibacteriales bacterium]
MNKHLSNKWKIFSFILILLLILTNVFWIYNLLDQGVTLKYSDQVNYEKTETVNQLLEIYPLINYGMDKSEVISKIKMIDSTSECFEKDGELIFGFLAFTFDSNNKLNKIEENSSY